MAELNPVEDTGSDAIANPADRAAEETQLVSSAAAAPIVEERAGESIVTASRPRLALRPRDRRNSLLAASVAIAAACGAVIGAAATGGLSKPAVVNVTGVGENKAFEQSVARLSEEISSLKASLVVATKSEQSQIGKIAERLRESAEISGSISPSQSVTTSTAPVPMPRPTSVGADAKPPAKVSIVAGWSIRGVRDGYAYVQRRDEIYEVVPGDPLPGVGRIEQIKRQDGRWVLVTPKGIIVSARDRRHFEQF